MISFVRKIRFDLISILIHLIEFLGEKRDLDLEKCYKERLDKEKC